MRQVKPAHVFSVPPILGFSLVIFFITLADGIMSYMAPITIEEHLHDPALVGAILSISSFFGIALDLFVADKLSHKSFSFFIKKAFIFAVLFPLILLVLPSKIVFFCVAMLAWSIYYEFIGYSKYNFVQKHVHLKEHTNAWGTLVTFSSLAYMIGPGIAVFLIHKFTDLPFYAAMVIVGISSAMYFLLEKNFLRKKLERVVPVEEKKNLLRELGLLKTLLKRLWILVIFTVSITLMDVLMWTVGVLYTKDLSDRSVFGGWLLVIYGLPALFVGPLTEKIKLDMGKKRMAFTSAAIAGLCLVFTGLDTNVYSILVFVFLMAVFSGVAFILLEATFQDFVARAGIVGNDIVSLIQFAHNLAYSFGPIILGIVAKYFGYGKTFMAVGGLVILVSIMAFIFTPRKIKMPQKEIRKELKELGGIGDRAVPERVLE